MLLSGKKTKLQPGDRLKWNRLTGSVTVESSSGTPMQWEVGGGWEDKLVFSTLSEFQRFARTIAGAVAVKVEFAIAPYEVEARLL